MSNLVSGRIWIGEAFLQQSLSWLSGQAVREISHYGITRDICKHLLAGGGLEDGEDSKRNSMNFSNWRICQTSGSHQFISCLNFPCISLYISYLLVISIHQGDSRWHNFSHRELFLRVAGTHRSLLPLAGQVWCTWLMVGCWGKWWVCDLRWIGACLRKYL